MAKNRGNRGVEISEVEKQPEVTGDDAAKAGKAEKKAKNQAKRAKKKAALISVLSFIKENSKDEELLAAVAFLTPGQRFGGVRTGMKDVIAEAFIESSEINENDIWAQYKLGRSEMRKVCVNLIKKEAPEDRMWISFDAKSEMYSLKGTGPDAPAEWTGYQPVDMDDIEI